MDMNNRTTTRRDPPGDRRNSSLILLLLQDAAAIIMVLLLLIPYIFYFLVGLVLVVARDNEGEPIRPRRSVHRVISLVIHFFKVLVAIVLATIPMIPYFSMCVLYVLFPPIVEDDGALGLQLVPIQLHRPPNRWALLLRSIVLIVIVLPLFVPLLFGFTIYVLSLPIPVPDGNNIEVAAPPLPAAVQNEEIEAGGENVEGGAMPLPAAVQNEEIEAGGENVEGGAMPLPAAVQNEEIEADEENVEGGAMPLPAAVQNEEIEANGENVEGGAMPLPAAVQNEEIEDVVEEVNNPNNAELNLQLVENVVNQDLEAGQQTVAPPWSPWILFLIAVILTLTHVVLGAITYIIVQPKHFDGEKTNIILDGLYWSIETIGTTGFGDIVPLSTAGYIATSVLVFIGSILRHAAVVLTVTAVRRIMENFIANHPSLTWLVDQQGKLKISTQVSMLFASLLLCLLAGTLVGHLQEKVGDVIAAWYFANMGSSSVGYGDMSFQTIFGRSFAIFWLLVSPTVYSELITLLAAQLILRWICL